MKCNREYRLSFTERAQKMVEKMSLEEKVSLMSGSMTMEKMMEEFEVNPNAHYNHIPYSAGGLDKYNLPPMLFCDGPRGVVCGTGKSTCFPVSMLRGASFDIDLEKKIGHAIGREIKAYGGNLFGGVCINLPYHPGWGRSQETYGEESFHLGEMGKALMTGVQEENVIASIKHYAFNQMEISRFKVSVDCDIRTEREVFLPHFKKCVDAGAGNIMSSYNLYKGTHCGHHDYLLNQVLKKEWGFDSFIMSDFGWGVRDTVEAVNGGQNMEMCGTEFFGEPLIQAVTDGLVSEQTIDDAALRIVRTLLAFTEGDDLKYNENILACSDHIALAIQSAQEGITLIQNKGNVLPFDENKIKKLVILGKLGNKENIGDHGSSQVFPPYVITPLQGIANAAPKVDVVYYSGENIEHAKDLAAAADAVVFVVGYDHDDEGEYISEEQTDNYTGSIGGDRKNSLELHDDEVHLLQEVGPVNRNSAAVLIGGNMIMMEAWKDSVNAVMMAYYPGMEGGNVIGDILFGHVNPSGKLPYIIPYKESDLPQVNWDTEQQHYHYYHGYAKLDKEGKEPLFPYGFGLSYTTFKVEHAEFTSNEQEVTAGCSIINTGDTTGTEVIQLYIGFQNSAVDRPIKLLRGFQRVTLLPQEKKQIRITCPVEELMWYNPQSKSFELEHMDYEIYIGTSSANKDLIQGVVSL